MSRLLRKYKLESFTQLVQFLEDYMHIDSIKNEFISYVTTHKTEFYREEKHFDIVLSEVRHLLKSQSEIRIWSSACSIGAEPYTIAIHLAKNLPDNDFAKIKILATDIDVESIKTASIGIYTHEQLFGLSDADINRFFKAEGDKYIASDLIKNPIYFSRLNLMESQYNISKKLDIILCRNVLIYFNQQDRNYIFANLVKNITDSGLILLAYSEAGCVESNQFRLTSDSVYRKLGLV